MDSGYGQKIVNLYFKAIIKLLLLVSLLVAIVSVGITAVVMTYIRPTPESVQRERDRKEIINELTPRQRSILNVQ